MLDKFIAQNGGVYTIYIDGSKKSGNSAVGSACICPELNFSSLKAINKNASVYTAECIALNDA